MSATSFPTPPHELATQERAQALAARGDVVGAARLMDEFLSSHDGDWGSWLYLAGLHGRIGRVGPAVAAYQACARQLEGEGRTERARGALQQAARLAPDDALLQAEIARLEAMTAGLREVPPPPPAPSMPARPAPRKARNPKEITTAVVARRASSTDAVPAQAAFVVVPAPSPARASAARAPVAPAPSLARAPAAAAALRIEPTPEPAVSAPRPKLAAVKTLRRSGAHAASAPRLTAVLPEPAPAPAKARRRKAPAADETFLMLPSITDITTDPYIAIFDILDSDTRREHLRTARPRAIRHDETTPLLPRVALR